VFEANRHAFALTSRSGLIFEEVGRVIAFGELLRLAVF